MGLKIDHFVTANGMKSKTVQFDAERNRKWIDSIIAVFDERLAEDKTSIGYDSDVPIFVLGMPRSADVYAVSDDVRVLSLSESEIRKIIDSDPEVAATLMLKDWSDSL